MAAKHATTLEALVSIHEALSDGTRLHLLNLMLDREVCVCYLVEVLGESQPKISRHLAYLRRSGLVKARREGRWMHYSIDPPKDSAAAAVLQGVREWMKGDSEMQRMREKLEKECCTTEKKSTYTH